MYTVYVHICINISFTYSVIEYQNYFSALKFKNFTFIWFSIVLFQQGYYFVVS